MQNAIEEQDAWSEIGVHRKSGWQNIVASLDKDRKNGGESVSGLRWKGRLAPSIVARNVAELFEVAMPRFAIRAEIDSEMGTSIVNLHRIALLQRQWQLTGNECGFELNDATGIGDSVLVWPGWVVDQQFLHQVRTPDLMRFYGEVYSTAETVSKTSGRNGSAYPDTTSYVHGLPLSGLCAQASCFMVSTMMQPWINNVYGFSEITLLSHEDFTDEEIEKLLEEGVIPKTAGKKEKSIKISLSGLKGGAFKRYFERAGLCCALQRPILSAGDIFPVEEDRESVRRLSPREEEERDRYGESPVADGADPAANLESAIRGYLRSGYSVIYPCDLGRLGGRIDGEVAIQVKTVTDDNGDVLERVYKKVGDPLFGANAEATESSLELHFPESPKDRRHAVVIVGCYRDAKGYTEFIFHDPSRLPYMTMSARELFCCTPYCDFKRGDQHVPPAPMLEVPGFYSITESEVRLPLLPEVQDIRSGKEKAKAPPSLARLHRQAIRLYDCPETIDREQLRQDRFHLGELILTNQEDLRSGWEKLTAEVVATCPGKTSLAEAIPGFLDGLSEWCHAREKIWVQVLRIRSLPFQPAGYLAQFWRAESAGTEFQESFLAGGFLRDGEGEWTVLHTADPISALADPADENKTGETTAADIPRIEPELAVITSFSAHGFAQLKDWPSDIRHCELYAFMAKDVESLIEGCSREEGLVPALAGRADRDDAFFEAVARKILANTTLRSAGVRIFAMATYLPEISCRGEDSGDLGELAGKALRFLIRLAGKIRALDPANSPAEKDAPFYMEIVGGGLAEGIVKNGDSFEAGIDSSESAIEHLVNVLCSVREVAVKNNVVLSVEFEPGLLNVLGHRKHLEKFCELLDDRKEETNFIGLNLDIAHFDFLGQITPDFVRKNTFLCDRIVHAHISDHSDSGHFGDAVVGAIHEFEHFAPWLDLLAEINARRGPESGAASILHPPQSRGNVLPFSGVVSIEQEACKSFACVSETIDILVNHRKTE